MKQPVPAPPRLVCAARAQRLPHAMLRAIAGVHREVAPPGAVVVPQVVVGVLRARSQRELKGGCRVCHEMFLIVWLALTAHQERPLGPANS